MSVFSENIGIKIKEVQYLTWDKMIVRVAPRPHNALVFRISGNADFRSGTVTASTSAGDVFFMPAGCGYEADYHEANDVIVVHFYSDLKADMENYHFENPHFMSSLFRKMCDIWNAKETGYYYSTLSVLCEILENIAVYGSSAAKGGTAKAFENAVEYMEENYLSADFSVEKAVAAAHMSNTYFRKLFIEKFGVTPSKYITAKRLNYAEKLLSSGKYTVERTAELSGFGDAKYFSRVVRKYYGCAPSQLYKVIK